MKMPKPPGSDCSWERLVTAEENVMVGTPAASTVKTINSEMQIEMIGSQAASSASQIGTEPMDRPGTQALNAPDSVLSIPKDTVPQLFFNCKHLRQFPRQVKICQWVH